MMVMIMAPHEDGNIANDENDDGSDDRSGW